jgi:hypothetical protein
MKGSRVQGVKGKQTILCFSLELEAWRRTRHWKPNTWILKPQPPVFWAARILEGWDLLSANSSQSPSNP